MLVGAVIIGAALRMRYAIPIAIAADLVLWWWVQESATGVFKEPSVGGPFSLVFAAIYAALVVAGLVCRAGVCAYRRRGQLPG
jgi:hypothetical protein